MTLEVYWEEVNVAALAAAFSIREQPGINSYEEHVVLYEEDAVPRDIWNSRLRSSSLLERWCDASEQKRNEVPALKNPAKLKLLRDLVAGCNILRDVSPSFGVNHNTQEGIPTAMPSWVIGGVACDTVIDAEFPGEASPILRRTARARRDRVSGLSVHANEAPSDENPVVEGAPTPEPTQL